MFFFLFGTRCPVPPHFPYGCCLGVGDNDNECATGLQCLQRTGSTQTASPSTLTGCTGNYHNGAATTTLHTAHPHCTTYGSGWYAFNSCSTHWHTSYATTYNHWDYCWDPHFATASAKKGMCQGACSSDSDCGPGLECFSRTSSSTIVPGCSANVADYQGTDNYCTNPVLSNPIVIDNVLTSASADNHGCGPHKKCGVCQGHCNTNSDCSPGLACFQRTGNAVGVPGCSTSSGASPYVSSRNYCYNPALSATNEPFNLRGWSDETISGQATEFGRIQNPGHFTEENFEYMLQFTVANRNKPVEIVVPFASEIYILSDLDLVSHTADSLSHTISWFFFCGWLLCVCCWLSDVGRLWLSIVPMFVYEY